MRYEIKLEKRPSVIYITLETPHIQRVNIIGFDPDPKHKGTVYFSRSTKVAGRTNPPIEIPMPITPQVLILDIEAEGGFGDYINVLKIDTRELPSRVVPFPKKTLEFYNFLKRIAEESSYMKPGFYISKDENFVIWAKRHLDGDSTPARVNRRTGVVKWNLEKINMYTVFVRIFIGMHEFFHYELQTTNEYEADMGALKVYLAMGFPKSEANYAMTKVFDNSPESIKRVQALNNYIKAHDNHKIPVRR